MPAALRDWVSDVLIGKIKKPKSSGKIAGATRARDKLILNLLDMLVDDVGMNPTSNDREHGTSACHAIAEAFSLLRLQPDSYDSILKIWGRRKKLRGITVPEDV